MALSTTINSITYTGGGSPYPIPFKFFSDTDIIVYVDGTVRSTGITLAGAGDDSGGTLTLDPDATSEEEVTIRRVVPLTQDTQFANGDPLDADVLESSFDYLMASIQQALEISSRGFEVPVNETGAVLPSADDRAGKNLAFDENGNPIAVILNPTVDEEIAALKVVKFAVVLSPVNQSAVAGASDSISNKKWSYQPRIAGRVTDVKLLQLESDGTVVKGDITKGTRSTLGTSIFTTVPQIDGSDLTSEDSGTAAVLDEAASAFNASDVFHFFLTQVGTSSRGVHFEIEITPLS